MENPCCSFSLRDSHSILFTKGSFPVLCSRNDVRIYTFTNSETFQIETSSPYFFFEMFSE